MKKLIMFSTLILLTYSVIMAGAKRINDYRSSKAITVSDSATTTSNTGYFPAVKITDAGSNSKYDHIDAVVYFSDMVGTDTALGNTDTVVVSWKFRFGDSTITARADTGTPPCQFIFNYGDYIVNTGTILGDSTAVIYSQSMRPYLYYDNFWFEYNVADSALATDSVGVTTMRYTVRFSESGN